EQGRPLSWQSGWGVIISALSLIRSMFCWPKSVWLASISHKWKLFINQKTMEVDNFFVHNLETDKLNIHTSKVFYEKLSEDEKKIFKQFCLWSRKQECWISKGKARNAMYLKSKLKELGFADGGTTGERLSFQEQVRREQEKAAAKAERAEQWAEKAEQR